MPISHISMKAGKPNSYRDAIADSVYQVLREELNVPEGDKFITISEHDSSNFFYGDAFNVNRSDDLLYISITVFDTRTPAQKRKLYLRLVKLLEEKPGVKPENVFINLYPLARENWSVGLGEMQFG